MMYNRPFSQSECSAHMVPCSAPYCGGGCVPVGQLASAQMSCHSRQPPGHQEIRQGTHPSRYDRGQGLQSA